MLCWLAPSPPPPPPTSTPDIPATVAFTLSQIPTATPHPTYTPYPTADVPATVEFELAPDCGDDFWAAAQQLAKTRNEGAVEAGYWGVMMFNKDADQNGIYHKEDAEMLYETPEIVLRMLG